MKWLKTSLKLVGSVTTFDGAMMNLSLMPSDVDADQLVVAATLEREDVVNKSLMPSGGNDEEVVLNVTSCRTR